MAHFNFVISQNAKWRHASFYIDCHRMTVPENILLQKKHCFRPLQKRLLAHLAELGHIIGLPSKVFLDQAGF